MLRERCAGCHRVFPPGSMTFPMWQMQLGRMRELLARQAIPWLTPEEEHALLDYLAAHAGTS